MIDHGSVMALVFGGINAVSLGLFGLYIRGSRKDSQTRIDDQSTKISSLGECIGDIKQRMTELSNGCFARHAKLERELGQREMETKAIHRRLDEK